MNSRIRRPLYISFKSWLCCCSLHSVAPQQLPKYRVKKSPIPQYRKPPCPPPSDHFYIILASITRTMFWALKKWGIKSSVLAPETQISVNFPYYLSQCCRLMLFVTKRETAFLLKKVKHMLYLGYMFCYLKFLFFFNQEVSFNFHFTFLQLNVIKMFIVK